jgi:mannose-6-phosphate isomerase-like protein (cupin superfamily)
LHSKPIRRVVTGHNAEGKSVFIKDDHAPHVYSRTSGSAVVTELWETRASPASNEGNDEVTNHPFQLAPPKGGTVFRIIHYPPDKTRLAALKKERAMGEDGSGLHAAADRDNPRHPGFHKTDSVDYAIVLQGEIVAMMDEGEVLLKQGDVLIQRGTNHAWSNRTSHVATLAFVLVDAKPLKAPRKEKRK